MQVFLLDDFVVNVREVVDYTVGFCLACFDLAFKGILDGEFLGDLLATASLELPEVFLYLLLLFFPQLLLFFLCLLDLLRSVVFALYLSDLSMQLPEKMLRVHRIILDLVSNSSGFLVLIKQKIILLRLSTIDDILLQLFLIHLHLLILKIVILLMSLVILQDFLQLVGV